MFASIFGIVIVVLLVFSPPLNVMANQDTRDQTDQARDGREDFAVPAVQESHVRNLYRA